MNIRLGAYEIFSRIVPGGLYIIAGAQLLGILGLLKFDLEFGGKIALRLPRCLHRQAVRFAERDRVSLNQFLVSAVASSVGAEALQSRIVEKVTRVIPVRPIIITRIESVVSVATTESAFNLPSLKSASTTISQ